MSKMNLYFYTKEKFGKRYRENCKDDYIRQFGDKEIDIFELYSRKY